MKRKLGIYVICSNCGYKYWHIYNNPYICPVCGSKQFEFVIDNRRIGKFGNAGKKL
ncbi:MAG: hypothetical protein DRN25_02200 [Thermoplasmata archaeon]|nr:MAG: hypothetical protein DRN25_02200 [Thermoplasmata archaeon]